MNRTRMSPDEGAWLGVLIGLALFAVIGYLVALNINPPPTVPTVTYDQVVRDMQIPAPGVEPKCETTITGYVICR